MKRRSDRERPQRERESKAWGALFDHNATRGGKLPKPLMDFIKKIKGPLRYENRLYAGGAGLLEELTDAYLVSNAG